jgi:uncharacterized membrane protein required for colicin V production
MSILVTILVALAFLVLGVVGMLRGVRASLLAIVGTFLGVLLVDLWQEPWGEWVRTQLRPEDPAFMTWMLTTGVFLLVVLLAGLGSSVLLPAPADGSKAKNNLRERLTGGAIGLLNGALVSGYLLHFAQRGLDGDDFTALLASLSLLGVLYSWLPWFMLALVAATGVFIMLRGTMRLSRASAANRAKLMATQAQTGTAQATKGGGASPQRQEAISRLNDKINNALGSDKTK